jgi:hypothetical protein
MMYNFKKGVAAFWVLLLFGSAALLPGSSGASGESQEGLKKVAVSLEKALPALVASKDYRSASNTAFLLAAARSRLDQSAAACTALSQSLEYYRKAIEKETGILENHASSIYDNSDGMAEIRTKFGCMQPRSA